MKKLELQIIDSGEIEVTFKVSHQTHREYEFGGEEGDTDCFSAPNKLRLKSCSCPEFDTYMDILYVRGHNPALDEKSLTASKHQFGRIVDAVKAYNICFSSKAHSQAHSQAHSPEEGKGVEGEDLFGDDSGENDDWGEDDWFEFVKEDAKDTEATENITDVPEKSITTQEKELQIKVTNKSKDYVTFHISKQTHINGEFGRADSLSNSGDSHFFGSSNCLELISEGYPEFSRSTNVLYVRSDLKQYDKMPMTVTNEYFDAIQKTIKEYNDHFKKIHVKREMQIEILSESAEWVVYRIAKQSHRGSNFSDQENPSKFAASNGIRLVSASLPAGPEPEPEPEKYKFETTPTYVYMAGDYKEYDSKPIVVPKGVFKAIKVAIKEYNETYSLNGITKESEELDKSDEIMEVFE